MPRHARSLRSRAPAGRRRRSVGSIAPDRRRWPSFVSSLLDHPRPRSRALGAATGLRLDPERRAIRAAAVVARLAVRSRAFPAVREREPTGEPATTVTTGCGRVHHRPVPDRPGHPQDVVGFTPQLPQRHRLSHPPQCRVPADASLSRTASRLALQSPAFHVGFLRELEDRLSGHQGRRDHLAVGAARDVARAAAATGRNGSRRPADSGRQGRRGDRHRRRRVFRRRAAHPADAESRLPCRAQRHRVAGACSTAFRCAC